MQIREVQWEGEECGQDRQTGRPAGGEGPDWCKTGRCSRGGCIPLSTGFRGLERGVGGTMPARTRAGWSQRCAAGGGGDARGLGGERPFRT